ncbi:hypothetical protein AYO41_01640 [Verrucomicrobia bacterium SCGC AG-212-E04]|nr:hypothetical protein AYO41_01640 [Verrucomicrobia bacterium SCGC AG-212-E04]
MLFFSELSLQLKPARIFVIGNAFGLSSVLLSLCNPNAKVIALDAQIEGNDNDSGTSLTNRIAREQKLDLEVIVGFSPDDVPSAVTSRLDGRIDLAFIDGLHTNEQQKEDFRACWEFGGSKCFYVLHDVIGWKLTSSFAEIVSNRPNMSSDVLWRTPSGMGLLYPEEAKGSIAGLVALFTESKEMIERVRAEAVAERLLAAPGAKALANMIPKRVLTKLRALLLSYANRHRSDG